MLLHILRHAWAEERDAEKFPDDDLRPLTGEGKKRFGKTVERYIDGGCRPTIVATSPLVRCRQTADILLKHLPHSAELVELDALRPGSNLDELIEWTRQQSAEEIAWVGHAPDVSDLAAALIGDGTASIRFAKGAWVSIRFDNQLAATAGELCALATAKLFAL